MLRTSGTHPGCIEFSTLYRGVSLRSTPGYYLASLRLALEFGHSADAFGLPLSETSSKTLSAKFRFDKVSDKVSDKRAQSGHQIATNMAKLQRRLPACCISLL